uniref:Uncharacterized protein n=1 Tax=Amphiprion percula TaxID=161767 RepID=A0A3P8TEA6_AMPPE
RGAQCSGMIKTHAVQETNLIPTVKQFCGNGTWQLALIDTTVHLSLYQSVLEDNVRPSIKQLKLNQQFSILLCLLLRFMEILTFSLMEDKGGPLCSYPAVLLCSSQF